MYRVKNQGSHGVETPTKAHKCQSTQHYQQVSEVTLQRHTFQLISVNTSLTQASEMPQLVFALKRADSNADYASICSIIMSSFSQFTILGQACISISLPAAERSTMDLPNSERHISHGRVHLQTYLQAEPSIISADPKTFPAEADYPSGNLLHNFMGRNNWMAKDTFLMASL